MQANLQIAAKLYIRYVIESNTTALITFYYPFHYSNCLKSDIWWITTSVAAAAIFPLAVLKLINMSLMDTLHGVVVVFPESSLLISEI